jgi:hypothetical protein
MFRFRSLLSALAGVLLLCGAAWSQTTFASITGTVTDSTGAVAPRVKVSATNVGTNIKTEVLSNEAGVYTVPQLKEGTYTVRAEAAGFKDFVAQDVTLVSRDVRRLDIQLQVGAIGTTVEVSGGATLIETETARISDTKGAMELKTLPLNTRGMWAFLALAPTVLQAGGGSSTIRFAGSNSNQSHWAIDGTTMSDGVDETQIGPFANHIESFQEVKIDMANNTAEFSTIGQVTIVSKSGTNQLHGTLFDYYSTPGFRARNPFALARGTGISHALGGGIGGPIAIPKLYNGHNRTFFYFSFETSRGSTATDVLNPTVPLPAWRSGDFSGLPAIYDPTTGQPFPGNIIPANRINPVSKLLQDRFYPTPNFGNTSVLTSQNFRQNLTRPYDPSTYMVPRIDHKISDHDSVFGRFTFQRLYNRTYEGNLPTIGRRIQQRDNRGATISETHTFAPNLINEFRWGYALNNNPVIGPLNGPQQVKELGLVGLASDLPDISGMLQLSWSGIGLTGLTQPNYTKPGFRNHLEEFQDHLSWFRGRHNLKFGLDFTRVEYDSLSANTNLFGAVTFSNRFTSMNGAGAVGGHPYADFLLGIPTTAARAFPPVEFDANRWQYDFFANDDFKVNSKLTINAGLRYEMHLPWRENHNRIAMFDIGSASIVTPDGMASQTSPLFPKSYVPIVEASKLGLPSSTLIRADWNNVAPRIGVAYRPWNNRTVFRAGYGIFYDVVPRTLTLAGLPYVLNEPSYTNPASNPDVIFPRVFPATGVNGPATVGIPNAYNPNLAIPYSMQYNFTIERQAWDTGFRVSYVGTAARKTEYAYNINQPVADNRPYVSKPRLFPQYPNFNYVTNGAGHDYNALTLEALRSMAKGLYFQASYTLARDIYDLTRGSAPEDAFNRSRERSVAQDIPTHRVNVNWVYQLPFGKGRKFSSSHGLLNRVAGNWEISNIYSLYSGQFLTPSWSGPDPTGTAFTTSATAIPVVTLRPDILRDANLPADQRSVNRWFDVSAFGAPAPGRFGTSAKGVIKGPGVNIWHVGLAKAIPLTERARLRAEITATNIFNHPQWSNPGTIVTAAASAGIITGVGGVNGSSTGDQPGPRALRASLRFEF